MKLERNISSFYLNWQVVLNPTPVYSESKIACDLLIKENRLAIITLWDGVIKYSWIDHSWFPSHGIRLSPISQYCKPDPICSSLFIRSCKILRPHKKLYTKTFCSEGIEAFWFGVLLCQIKKISLRSLCALCEMIIGLSFSFPLRLSEGLPPFGFTLQVIFYITEIFWPKGFFRSYSYFSLLQRPHMLLSWSLWGIFLPVFKRRYPG